VVNDMFASWASKGAITSALNKAFIVLPRDASA